MTAWMNKPSAGGRAIEGAHATTTRLSVREITRRLNAGLGAALVAGLAGSRDAKVSYEWARADGPSPKTDSERRLRFAYGLWLAVSQVESEDVARAWCIGLNPWLDEASPIDAIREGRFKEVAAAAAAMIDDAAAG
jgi:hypothetical protein